MNAVREPATAPSIPKWQRLGYSSHEDYKYHRQNKRGTNSGRYQPRDRQNLDQVRCVPAHEMTIIDRLINELEATVSREGEYPKDSGSSFCFEEQAHLPIRMAGRLYLVEIIRRWDYLGRLRYRLHFSTEHVSLMVTQEQLIRIVELPVAPREHRLLGATFTSDEAFENAKRRVARNWARQLKKNQQPIPVLFSSATTGYSKERETYPLYVLDTLVRVAFA